jgi:checkpoint serine/threonine-protein kinase
MHLFTDECYLMLSYRDQGTLLDLVNLAKTDATLSSRGEGPTGQLDETLALFFTVELLRVVEALHAKGIMHGDLKADNCLVRLEPTADANLSPHYQANGSEGWDKKGLTLIDFGRGIDMRCFLPDVQFIADWQAGPQDCPEMREMRPWTWQLDMHGMAGIAHSLLFGKYLETVLEKGSGGLGVSGKRYVLKERFKRYWQVELWEAFFALCLNPGLGVEEEGEGVGKNPPRLKGMKRVREAMEKWLEGNAERGVGLKVLIRRAEERIRETQGKKR